MKNNQSLAQKIHENAYDMFPLKHEPSPSAESPFSMYSYERVSYIFWGGFIEELLNRGLGESETRWLLRSKHMRWMLDSNETLIENLAKSMVTEDMIKEAKDEGEEDK